MNNKFSSIAVVFFLIAIVSGCTKDVSKLPTAPEPGVKDFPEQKTSKLSAHIFIDRSESMAGYAMPCGTCRDKFKNYGVPDSNYYKLLHALPEAMLASGAYNGITYHVFSDKIDNMSLYNFKKVLKSNFYAGTTSPIDEVIDDPNVCKATNLTVIITDLYQKESYIEPLVHKVTKGCIEKQYAIGVWAIKSQFAGRLFDLDLEDRSAAYFTEGKKEGEYKAFYLLIIGKHRDVEAFYENLSKSVQFLNQNNSRFNIISPYLEDTPAVLNTEKAPLKKDLNCLKNSNYEIRCNATAFTENSSTAWVKTTLNYFPLKYSVPFKANGLTAEVSKVEVYKGGQYVDAPQVKKDTATVNVTSQADNTLAIEIKNNLKELPEGIYRYELYIRPTDNSYQHPEWWSEWSTEDPERDPRWKTLHQRLFLRSIWKASYDYNRPAIGKFYYVVGK